MRKKIFSILMTLALVISLIPASTMTAFASTVQWESEPNDYIQHADEIHVGDIIKGEYTVEGSRYNCERDEDFFRFTLDKGCLLQFNGIVIAEKLGENVGDLYIRLAKESEYENSIAYLDTDFNWNYGYSKGEDILSLSPGTYILEVEGTEGYTFTYEFSFNLLAEEAFAEPNDYIDIATELSLNQDVVGVLTLNEDYDMFKLSNATGGGYYVNLTNESTNYVSLSSFDSQENELDWMSVSQKEDDGRNYIRRVVTLLAGTAYFRVSGDENTKYRLSVVKQPAATSNISTSLYGYNDIAVNWNPVPEAEGYRVYYKKSTEEDFVHWGNTTEPSMQMAGCADDMGYCFKIVAYKTVNGVIYEGEEKTSDYIYTLKKVNKPTATKAGGASVTLSWTDISGESGYEIAKSASKDSGYTISKTVGANKENVTVKTAWNKPFYYKVRAFKTVDGTKIYGPWSTPVKRTRYLAVPARMKVKLSGDKTVSVSWSKVSGASGYNVYYKKASASKYTFLKRTTATSIKKTGLANGTKYKFKVVPYAKVGKKRYETTASKTVSAFILEKVNQPKVKKVSQNYITVSWNNIAGESGYQIAKSTFATKNFNIIETVGKSCSKAKISSKRNKTYYYKVRAYKYIDGNRVYGSWSEAKAFNLK